MSNDGEIQIDLGTGGTFVDTSIVNTGAGASVNRQRIAIGDASAAENFLAIGADGAASVHLIGQSSSSSVSANITNPYIPVTQQGNWAASINNIVPVSQSGSWAASVDGTVVATQGGAWTVSATQQGNYGASISNFPTNQAVTQGTVPWAASVEGQVGVTQITSPWVISGNVTAQQGGNYGASISNFPAVQPVSQQGNWGASITNQPTVLQGNAPWTVAASQSGNWGASVTQGTSPWVTSGTSTVSGSVSSIQTGTWYTTVSGSVTAIPYGVQTVSGSVSVLNPSSGGGSASVSILNSALLPTADASADASLAIIGIPNIDKAVCDALTLTSTVIHTWNLKGTLAASVAASGAITIAMVNPIGPSAGIAYPLTCGVTGSSASVTNAADFPNVTNGMTASGTSISVGTTVVSGAGTGASVVVLSSAYTGSTGSETITFTQESFLIQIDSEQMLVTSGNGTTSLTVTAANRGYNSTIAATHANGAAVTTIVGWTPNEIEISGNGVGAVYYTLDGTPPSPNNFTGVLQATPASTILPCSGSGPNAGGTQLQVYSAGNTGYTAALRGA